MTQFISPRRGLRLGFIRGESGNLLTTPLSDISNQARKKDFSEKDRFSVIQKAVLKRLR